MYKLDELIYRLILLTVFFPAFIFGYIQQTFAFDLKVSKENYSCGTDNNCQTTNDNNDFSVKADTIINYAIKYENIGQDDASGVYIIEKIAEGSCYVVNSIESNLPEGGSILYSTDDVPTFPAGGLRVIPSPDSNGTDCAITAFKLSLTNSIPPSSTIYIEDDESDFNGDASSTVITRDGSIKLQIPATFSQSTISAGNTGFTSGVKVDDIDNDGDLDIIGAGNGGPSYIYFQTAPNTYNEIKISATSTLFVDRTIISDIDADGDKDLIMGGENYPTYIFLQGPTGTFTETQISAGNTYIRGKVKIIDIDNDGRLDIIGAGYNDKTKVFYQNANGTFTEQNISNTTTTFRGGIEVYDLDDDGDLDLVGGGYFGKTYWYKQTAARVYQEIVLSSSNTAFLGGLIITDISNDANTLPDIVGGGFFGDSFIYKQTSQGIFSEVLLPGGATRFYSKPIVIDIEGDNDKDIVGGGYGKPTYLYSQNQSGNFQRSQISTDNTYFYSGLKSVDIDFDGDNDILGVGFNSHSFLYRNNNDGSFDEIQLTLVIANFIGNLEVIDINGDTHLDVVGGSDAGKSYYLINDGKLNFTQYELSGDTTYFKGGVEVADMDKDGDSDIVAGADGGRTYVFSNTSQYTSSGTYSVVIDSHGDVSAWDKLFASETIPSNTNIEYRIRDVVTDTCGSTDLIAYTVSTSGELDLSGINPSKDSICLTIKLTTTNVTLTPEVDMFNVTFTANSEKSFTYKTRTKSDLLSSSFGIVTSDVQIYPENGDTQLTNNRTASGLIIAKSEQSDLSILKTSYSCGADNNCSTLGDNDKTKVRENEIINYVVKFQNRGSAASEKTEIIDSIPDKTCYTANSIESLIPSTFPSYKLYYSNDDRMTWVYKPSGSTVDCNVTDIKLQLLEPYKAKGEFEDFGDVTNGLVGHWKLDEENGNYAYDASGNNNTGTLINNPSFSTGKIEGALNLDGTNDYVDLGNKPSLNSLNQITVSSWVYLTGSGTRQLIAEKHTSPSHGWWLARESNNKLIFVIVDPSGNSRVAYTSIDVPINQWVLVTGVYDGKDIKNYINGVEYTSGLAGTGTGPIRDSANSLVLGWQRWSGGTFLNGKIDDFRIYNRALSPNEVEILNNKMNFASSTNTAISSNTISKGLNAHWKLDEIAGTSALDSSGNGITGTLTNGPIWTSGKKDNGIKFDGVNDFISTNTTLNDTSITYSAWVNPSVISDDYDAIIGDWWYHAAGGDKQLNLGLRFGKPYAAVTKDTAGTELTATNALTPGQWAHLTTVYDKEAGTLKLYVNGILASSNTATTLAGTHTKTVRIGVWRAGPSATDSRFFNGKIDDVRIYSRPLSGQEAYNLFIEGTEKFTYNDNLVGYWKMDEASWNGTAGEVKDTSGFSFNGTGSGGVTSGAGKLSNGGIFDGTDDYITVPNNETLKPTKAITLSHWVKYSGFGDRWEISNSPSTFSYNNGFSLREDSPTNKAGLFIGHGSTYSSVWSTTTLNTGTWYLVTGVYDGSLLKIYINGVLENTVSANGNVIDYTGVASSLYIGQRADNTLRHYGSLDEVRIYNKALTDDEVKDLYVYAPNPTKSPAPVAEWKFDESTGTIAYDSSGNDNVSSTFIGGTTRTLGKYNSALYFDGSDDYVPIPETPLTDLGTTTDSITVSAWVNTKATFAAQGTVVAKDDGSGAYPFVLYISSNGYACFKGFDTSNVSNTCSSFTVNDGKWHYISGTRNIQTDKYYIYVDGVLANSSTDITTLTMQNNDNWVIGNGGNSYVQYDYLGLIDEVKIYNYARSQSQIVEDMYNSNNKFVNKQYDGQLTLNNSLFKTDFSNAGFNMGTSDSNANHSSPILAAEGKNNIFAVKNQATFDGFDDYLVGGAKSITGSVDVEATIRPSFVTTDTQAGWWDKSWFFRRSVTLNNTAVATITNQLVKITLDTSSLISAGKIQSDCDDVRVTDINGNLLNHWDTQCNTASSIIYAKIPTLPSTGTTLYLYYGNTLASSIENTLGTTTYPGTSCKMMKDQGSVSANGLYYIVPGGNDADKIQVYCDVTTLSQGWTVAINSNRAVATNPEPVWNDAINSINTTGTFGTNLNSFDLILGLRHWNHIGDTALVQIGSNASTITKRATYSSISLNTSNSYSLSLGTETIHLGGVSSGFKNYHAAGNYKFTTSDADNDVWSGNCSNAFGGSPWWYGACWSGSFWGGGDSGTYQNAPFWTGSSTDYNDYGAIMLGGADTMKNVTTNTPATEERSSYPSNPIIKWDLDELAGAILQDTSGNNNNGTLVNSPSRTIGVINGGVSFDGVDDYAYANLTVPGNNATVTMWVKDIQAGVGNYLFRSEANLRTYISISGNIIFFSKGNPSVAVASAQNVNLKSWNHLALRWWTSGGTQYAEAYVNGVSTGSPVIFLDNRNGTYASIAAFTNAGTQNAKGTFDNVRIYNYALSANEILQEFRASQPIITGGTIISKGENYESSLNPISTNNSTLPYQTKAGFSTNAITSQLNGTATNDVFWYDTTLDTDYGTGKSTDPLIWRFDVSKSWYNETIDATYTGCNIATHDRCGTRFFPEKAYIVATNTNVYIFDAQENAMWMRFDIRPVSGPWTSQVILTVDGAAPKALFMLNGKMYIGNNLDFASYGLHVINFLNDTGKKYSVSDYASTYNGTISTRNNYTSYGWGGAETGVTIVNSVVNDISVAVISEKTYIAVATDVGVSVINETNNTVINITETFSNWRQSHVFLANDDLYIVGQESTNAQGSTGIGAYYNINTITTNITTPENSNQYYWGQNYPWPVPSLLFSSLYNGGGPLVAGNKINDIYVTKGTSTIDGISNTIFLSSQIGTSILQEKQGDESNGSVKYITKDYVSEEMVGDIRGMWPFYGSGNIANNTYNIDDVSIKGSELTAKNTNGTGMAYVNGVRGKGISFDGTDDFLCTDTNDDGTCDNNTNLNFTGSFTVGAWVKKSTSSATAFLVKGDSNNPINANRGIFLGYGFGTTCGTNNAYIFGANNIENEPCSIVTDITNWHHVVGVFDGTSRKLYIDGEYKSQSTSNLIGMSNNYPLLIGAYQANNVTAGYWNGSLDEIFITGEALTNVQIKNMYEIGRKALEEGVTKTNGTGSATSLSTAVTASGLRRIGSSNYTASTLFFSMGATGNILYEMDLGSDSIVSSNTVGNIAKIVPTSGGKNITATASGVRRVNDVSGKEGILPNKDTSVRGYFNKLDGYYKLYENGVEVGKTYVGQAHTPTANSEMYTIGSKSSGLFPGNFYNGTIKSVDLWKTDLTGTFEKIITPTNIFSTWQNLVINSTLPPGTNIKYTIYGYNNGCNYSNVLYGPSNAAGITNISTILPSNTTVCLRGNLTTNDYKTLPSLDSYELTHSSSTYDQIEFRSKVDLSMGMAGPIAHWKLDEGTGTSATDSSGNGKTGTLTNGPVWIDGKISKGLAFDGTDDYVNVTNLSLDSTITLSAWIRSSAYEGKIPLSINSDGFASGPNLFFWGGTVSWNTGDSGNNPFYTGAYPNSNWHHYAIVNDASANNAKLYIDGVFRGQAGYRNSTTTNGSFQIGRFHDGGYNINGLIDDVKIFSRALTASEIANIYNTNKIVNVAQITSSITDPITDNNTDTNVLPFDIPSPDLDITISGNSCGSENNCTLSTGLVGHWKFDRALAADNLHATDSSTNNNHGTLVGGPTFLPGKNDSAISFDGVDDRITASAISGLTAANTKAVWINPAQFTTGMNQYLLDMGGNNNWIELVDHDNDGLPIIRAGFNGSNFVDTTLELPVTSRWYHIVSASTTTNIAIYVDGVLEASAAKTSVSPGAITIGDYSSTGYRFKGLMDDLRIYNRTLAADEVRYLSQIVRPSESIQYKADVDNINSISPRDFETINLIPDGTCYTVGSIENTLPNYVALSYSNDDIPTFGYTPIADSNGTDCFVTAYKIVYTDSTFGLVGYWTMDEASWNGTAGEVKDSSGNSIHATRAGDATTNTGKYGRGGTFDGTGDFISTVSDNNLLDFGSSNNFTVSTWARVSSPTTYHSFLGKCGQNNSCPGYEFFMLNNFIYFRMTWSGGPTFGNTTYAAYDIRDNSWHHLAAVIDRQSNTVSLYANGKLLSSTDSNISSVGSIDNSDPFTIGTAGAGAWKGDLDDVRIYNRALSALEVKSLYNNRPGPAAHWKFDEGTGTSATDSSGNGNTVTLTSGPAWSTGKYGNSISFSGNTQKVLASNPILSGTGDYTLSAWVKQNTIKTGFIMGNYGTGACSTGIEVYLHNDRLLTYISGYATGNIPIGTSNWVHVASSRRNGSVSNYVNGVLDITVNLPANIGTNCNFAIGNGPNYNSENFVGMIDDVQIYNRALSDQEILRSYNNNLYSYDFKVKANPALTDLSQITNSISSIVDPDRNQIEIITSNNSSTNILDIKYSAIISGKVWNDRNNNGIQENGEPGINGTNMKIYLDNNSDGTADGAALSTATTATDVTKGRGFYKFDNLNVANKYLIGLDPADTTQIAPKNTAPFNINNDFSNTTRLTDTITLTLIDNNKDHIDLGLVGTKTISGYIWEDNDNSGSIDNETLARHGIDAITINLYEDTNLDGLYGSGDGLYASTTSDENGAYSFGSLLSNKYIVVISEDSFELGQPLHNCKSSDDQYPNVADHGRYTGDNITSGQIDLSTAPNATGINFGFLLGEKPAPWLTGWTYRVPISVQGNTVAVTDYQVSIDTNTQALVGANKLSSDCKDIRFTDSDMITPLNYWIDNGCNTTSTRMWTKIPSIPTEGKAIYMYYGNNNAVDQSNGVNTFEFFDDFSSGSLKAGWSTNGGTWTQASGVISQTNAASSEKRLIVSTASNNIAIEASVRPDSFGSDYRMGVVGRMATQNGYNSTIYASSRSQLAILDDLITWGSPQNIGFTYNTGTWYKFRLAMYGNNQYAKSWALGSAEPANWQVTQAYTSKSANNAGLNGGLTSTATFDNFFVRKFINPQPGSGLGSESTYSNGGGSTPTPSPTPTPPVWDATSGLIAYWPLNEGTGTTTDDASINNYIGNLINGPTWLDGKFNKATSLDGSNDYINMGAAVAPSSNLTISAWIYPRNAENSTTWGGTIYNWGLTTGCNPSSQMFYIKSNTLQFNTGCGTVLSSAAGTIQNNQWYHVALGINTSGETTLYINGVTASSPTNTRSGQSVSTGNDKIGATHAGGTLGYYFNGNIDDIRIYNRVLDSQEINSLYSLIP